MKRSFSSIQVLSIILVVHLSFSAYSQNLYLSNPQPTIKITAWQPPVPAKKRFWRAAAEWSLVQMIPWASNRYMRNADFAKISFKSIGHNLNPNNLEWDDNKFFTNQIFHPYQGSLYFNAFRTNGYSFWQSAPSAIAGSLVWEIACETHLPAPNDLINTSLGGICVGEMSYRISRKLLGRKNGIRKSVVSVPTSIVINPVNSLNYLLDGQERKENPAAYIDETPMSVVADAGTKLNSNKEWSKSGSRHQQEIFYRIRLQYGDPFTSSKQAFSNFSMNFEAGNADSGNVNLLQIEGSLYTKNIKQTTQSSHSYSISMNYDFFQNSSFNYGAQSFRANMYNRYTVSGDLQVSLKGSVGFIALAAVPNPHMYYGEGRSYDYCMGVNLLAGASVSFANKFFYDLNCTAAGFKTVNGYSGSHQLLNVTSSLRMVLYNNLSITASTDTHYFNSDYKNYPDAAAQFRFVYVGLGYKVTL